MFSKFNKFNFILFTTLAITGFQLYSMEKEEQINESTKLLFEGVKSRDLNQVEQALKQGAEVNAVDDRGFTALMWVSILGCPAPVHLDIVKLLLQFGIDVNTSTTGYTALSVVIGHLFYNESVKKSIIKYLVAAGADGQSALEIARENKIKCCQQYGGPGGPSEADEQRIDEQMRVAAAVIQEGKQIFAAIFEAAQSKNHKKLKEFIDQGYTLNIRDQFGNTPLHWLIRNADADNDNDLNLILLILEQPYAQNLLHAKNEDGHTPMHLAANKPEILRLLVARGFLAKKELFMRMNYK